MGLSPVVNTLAGLSFSPGDDHEDVVDVGEVEDVLLRLSQELLIVIQCVD